MIADAGMPFGIDLVVQNSTDWGRKARDLLSGRDETIVKLATGVAIATTVALLSGCAATASKPAATARTPKVVYAGMGVSTVPAPANAHATVTATSALTKANSLGFRADGDAPVRPSVALRLITGREFVGDGARPVAVKNRLAWVLTYHHSKAVDYGGYGTGRPSPGLNCDFTIIIDATTAATVANFQICPPVPTA